MSTATTRSTPAKVGNALLTVAALGGIVCILLVVLAVVFNITLIMFKTGSMSPTIPTGSLAVVRLIPATEAHVGDVVTVDRPGDLPVTHRITSVTPQDNGFVSITLRGDANPTDDPAPYVVNSVRIVLVSVPGLAYAVAAVSNPIAMGAITILATGIVLWAFWPRDSAARRARREAIPTRSDRVRTRGHRSAPIATPVLTLPSTDALELARLGAPVVVAPPTVLVAPVTPVSPAASVLYTPGTLTTATFAPAQPGPHITRSLTDLPVPIAAQRISTLPAPRSTSHITLTAPTGTHAIAYPQAASRRELRARHAATSSRSARRRDQVAEPAR